MLAEPEENHRHIDEKLQVLPCRGAVAYGCKNTCPTVANAPIPPTGEESAFASAQPLCQG
jgi:hypothetical protein